jgi:PAS domain S-box-containing protein
MRTEIRDPEAELTSVTETLHALRDVVHGFGEAQTLIRDLDGGIMFWSRGAERLYGWSCDEAIGARSHDLLATQFPLDLTAINARLHSDGTWQGELTHRHRSGRAIHVASHWVLRRGDRPTVVEVNNDISERHRADAMQRYHDALVADSDDAIIAKTLDGTVTSWNHAAERMFGWLASEIIGRPITTIIPEDRLADEAAIIRRLRQGERITHFETVRQHRDGSSVLVSLTVSPIRDATGAIVGASKIARDISRQRQTEQMLQRVRRMTALGELTGGVAHDFNNLLSVIVNNVELLRRMMSGQPELDAMARDILTAALSGGALTRRLLTFARQQTLTLEVIDLNGYLPSYVELLRRTLGQAIEIETRFAGELWLVRADASQIGDALINLALNARDAMPVASGRITIETANRSVSQGQSPGPTGEFVALTVSDNGSGMQPEVLERAMEPFFTTKPIGQGNGLGLSMVHGTIAQHGGFVDIRSAPGDGTSVTLFLPRVLGESETRPTEADQAAPRAGAGETVMVVDDNPQLRGTVIRGLTMLGYRTVEAADGVSCLARLEAGEPCDLLFSDVVMPGGMTGLQLARIARRLRPALPVLLTTGFSSSIDIAENEPACEVLRKPYRFQQLAEAVQRALARAGEPPPDGSTPSA